MRIAFTSCFSAALFPRQPVWREIAAARPDRLVLLGDSIYLDCSGGLAEDGQTPLNTTGVKTLSATAFARHAHGLYRQQWQQADFQALLATGLSVHAIWDDHDFLWNDACGGDLMGGPLESLVYPSRAMFAAWCDALAGSAGFPAAPPAWSNATPPPGYRHADLGDGVHLHLTDDRSWRRSGGQALLGAAQLDAMEAAMQAAGPGATHLLASGSVVEQRGGESWLKCEDEYQRLLALAQRHNILVLSGDIHDNNLAAYKPDDGTRFLFEATASGAALRTAVALGSLQRNWGLLDIDAGNVHISIFKSNPANPQYRGTIDRLHWT